MPVRHLKKYLPTPEQVRNTKSLQFLGEFLHDPNIWHLNRYSASGACAVGLFMSYMPIPMQMLPAALLAILFRVNLPITLVMVWVSNPFTLAPMFYLAYIVGTYLTGVPAQPFHFEPSLNWLFMELGSRWRPFLLGCLLMGTVLGLAGLIAMRLLWRLHLLQRIKERKILRHLGINRFIKGLDHAQRKIQHDVARKNAAQKKHSKNKKT